MSHRSIEFPAKDLPLRDDVRMLGEIVGEVLREQSDDGLFARVETVRALAIARRERRQYDDGDSLRLETEVAGLTPDEAGELIRAFSTYFQAVNLAEQIHRVRRGRTYLMPGAEPQRGSIASVLQHMARTGVSAEDARAIIHAAQLQPVFTAHPTEATRRVVLEKQLRIADRLIERMSPDRTEREERVALARIRSEISTGWQTEEHPRHRPSVADEREHVLYYVAGVLYQVLPAFHEAVEEAFAHAYGDDLAGPVTGGGRHEAAQSGAGPTGTRDRPLLQVASWVGGDMDGNPSVGADTIRRTLARHRELILRRYVDEVHDLSRQLTQSESRASWSTEVTHRTRRYEELLPEAAAQISNRGRRMGYRVLLRLIAARLDATASDTDGGYGSPEDFVDDVHLIERSLDANRGRHAGMFAVRRLRRRAETFGFHLATLDVRQDARAHRDVMAALLHEPDWTAWTPERRTARLRTLLLDPEASPPGLHGGRTETGRAGDDQSAAAVRATDRESAASRALDVFSAIRDCRDRYGPAALGPFVISMARDVDDVLTVLLLARWGGLSDGDGVVPLDIAPLFETVPDLERAGETLGALFSDPVYAPHLERRNGRQMVMVGYSDSNKDGGIASSRWSLQKAQHRMAERSESTSTRLTIFHGRGGTVSRGGGKVYRAVAAAPAAALSGRLRLTEQGEVIDAKYGVPSIALRNLERMLGAVALKGAETTAGPPAASRPEWHAIAETLAAASRSRYRALVYDEPDFTIFFRHATPIDVVERMTIGSRPSSRRAQAGIEDLRAIPWVFAWTQTRATLPGWYGLGSGLEAAVTRHGLEEVAQAVAGWPFLSALVDDVEMVLAKSDMDIARRYVGLAPESTRHVFDAVREEFERTVHHVLSLKSTDQILVDDPTLRRSIRLRNPYVDPMNLLQVDLLERWRASDREDEGLFDALLASVQGIARGLKNTG